MFSDDMFCMGSKKTFQKFNNWRIFDIKNKQNTQLKERVFFYEPKTITVLIKLSFFYVISSLFFIIIVCPVFILFHPFF